MMCTITKEDFIAYKSAGDYVVELNVPVGSRTNIGRKDVVNPKRAMFRCDKARVLSICHKKTGKYIESVFSNHDEMFQYIVGKDVVPKEAYDTDPDEVRASGIHFFLIRETAYLYAHDINDGLYQDWYDNGQLRVKCMVKNNEMDGELKRYHKNGKCQSLEHRVNGTRSGLSKEWHEDEFLHSIRMDKDAQVTQIGYYDDKHTMCIKIYNTNGYFPEYHVST